MPSGGRFGKNDRSDWEFLMETPRRSFDEISRLYEQLADQMSAKNEEEIRRVHRELLRTGELVGTIIVGRAMSSIHKAKESGRAESAINELPGTQRVSVVLQQGASEVTLPQRPPGVDVYIDRSEHASAVCNELPGADGDNRPLRRRVQTVPTQVTSEAETTEPAAEAFTDITDDPRLISPAELGQSPSLGSGLQLRARLFPAAVATRAILVLTAAVVATAGTGLLWRAHRPTDEYRAGVLQHAVVSPLTLATAAVAAGFSGVALSAAFPVASGGLNVDTGPTFTMPSAAPPEKAANIAAAPTTVPIEAPVSTADVSALLKRGDTLLTAGEVASAGLSMDTRPTVTMPSAAPPEHATAIAAAPAIVPTEAPVSPTEMVNLLQRGDILLTAGEVASAELRVDTRQTVMMPSAAPTEKAAVITAAPAIVPTEAPVSPADVSALLQRGDALLAAGDVASARLFYERAAMAGDAAAALRLGGSYDPLFLARAGLTGVHSNRTVAARWYRRASELGAREAKFLLKSTEAGQD
jgi:hypothetical protein